MKVLLHGKLSKLNDEYQKSVSELKEFLKPKDGVEQRQIKKYAVLLAAIPYITEAWGFQLDRQAIINIFKETFEDNKLLQPVAEVLYDKFVDEIIGDKIHYPAKDTAMPNMGAAHGEEAQYNAKPCFWIVIMIWQRREKNRLKLSSDIFTAVLLRNCLLTEILQNSLIRDMLKHIIHIFRMDMSTMLNINRITVTAR